MEKNIFWNTQRLTTITKRQLATWAVQRIQNFPDILRNPSSPNSLRSPGSLSTTPNSQIISTMLEIGLLSYQKRGRMRVIWGARQIPEKCWPLEKGTAMRGQSMSRRSNSRNFRKWRVRIRRATLSSFSNPMASNLIRWTSFSRRKVIKSNYHKLTNQRIFKKMFFQIKDFPYPKYTVEIVLNSTMPWSPYYNLYNPPINF